MLDSYHALTKLLVPIRVPTGCLLGDVTGDHEVVGVTGNEIHAVDAKEID